MSLPEGLEAKLEKLSSEQADLIEDLCSEELGQSHLFTTGANIKELAAQLEKLDGSYPGGLRSYILKAKELLKSKSTIQQQQRYRTEMRVLLAFSSFVVWGLNDALFLSLLTFSHFVTLFHTQIRRKE